MRRIRSLVCRHSLCHVSPAFPLTVILWPRFPWCYQYHIWCVGFWFIGLYPLFSYHTWVISAAKMKSIFWSRSHGSTDILTIAKNDQAMTDSSRNHNTHQLVGQWWRLLFFGEVINCMEIRGRDAQKLFIQLLTASSLFQWMQNRVLNSQTAMEALIIRWGQCCPIFVQRKSEESAVLRICIPWGGQELPNGEHLLFGNTCRPSIQVSVAIPTSEMSW
jgi:hypothetical protein